MVASPLGSHCQFLKACVHSYHQSIWTQGIWLCITFQFRDAPFKFHNYLIIYIHVFWVYLNFYCLTADSILMGTSSGWLFLHSLHFFLLFQATVLEKKSKKISDKLLEWRWHEVLWGCVQLSLFLYLINKYWYPEKFSICIGQLDWESGMKRS